MQKLLIANYKIMIITRKINPPIPSRKFDWEATKSNYDEGDPIGYGETEIEAIQDLINQED